MCFTFKKGNKRTKKPVHVFFHYSASAVVEICDNVPKIGSINIEISVNGHFLLLFRAREAQSKVIAYTMLVPIGEIVTLFSDFSLDIFYPFL